MIQDESVDLITAGRAIQYFDFDNFSKECKRILKPNGVVAFYSSDHTRFVIPDEPGKAAKLNERFRKVNKMARSPCPVYTSGSSCIVNKQ